MDERHVAYLRTRRSIPSPQMSEPSPDAETLRVVLEIAARVPDHGKLAPWRFVIYAPEDRKALVDGLIHIAALSSDEKEQRSRADKARGLAATPLIIGVVSAPRHDHPKIPVWEQQLSAGAVCLNLMHAAHAHGFAAQWLTGWYAYDEQAARWLGIAEGERLAGFIHIGTPTMPASERDRPDIGAISSRWRTPAAG
jgi:nitroreductase